MGEVPPFFDPARGPWRAGSALRASPARLMKGGGQNKGDFSHLGDSPPLPAVPITGIEYKDRI